MKLDRTDIELINNLYEDNDLTLKQLGDKVDLSHVAVKKRLDKLKNNGILENKPCLNLSELDYKVGVTLVELDNEEQKDELLEHYENCPRVIFYTELFGAHNLLVLRVVKDLNVLKSEKLNCADRKVPNNSRIEYLGTAPLSPKFFPFKYEIEDNETSPCGCLCTECKSYKKDCPGCPRTIYYTEIR